MATVSELLDQYAEKYQPGDAEFRKIIHAIALAESGGRADAIGDNGDSIGVFQANMAGGRGAGYTKEQLFDPEFNIKIAMPEFLTAYSLGRNMGLRGRDLVAYVSRTAQRPEAGLEWRAADNYGRFVGQDPISMNEKTTQAQYDLSKANESSNKKTTKIDPYEMVDTLNVRTGEMGKAPRYPEEYKKAEYLKKNKEFVNKSLFEKIKDYLIPEIKANESTLKSSQYPIAAYIVQPGDTLWSIAEKYLGSGNRWKELQGYSGSQYTMPIGTKLTINKPISTGGLQPTVSNMRPAQTSVQSQTRVATPTVSTRGVSSGFVPIPTPVRPPTYVAPQYQQPTWYQPVQQVSRPPALGGGGGGSWSAPAKPKQNIIQQAWSTIKNWFR